MNIRLFTLIVCGISAFAQLKAVDLKYDSTFIRIESMLSGKESPFPPAAARLHRVASK